MVNAHQANCKPSAFKAKKNTHRDTRVDFDCCNCFDFRTVVIIMNGNEWDAKTKTINLVTNYMHIATYLSFVLLMKYIERVTMYLSCVYVHVHVR